MAKRKKQISTHGYQNSGEKIEQSQEDAVRKELFDTLKMYGITLIKVQYSGSGDSGQTDDIDITPEKRHEMLDEKMESGKTIRDALDEFAWKGIEDNESGFYNNEGGYGEIIFDVAERTVKMEHNNYIQETVYSEYDL
jgi:hypothetical protein